MSASLANIHQSNGINLVVYKTSPPYPCLTLLKNACILIYANSEFLFPAANVGYQGTVNAAIRLAESFI